MTLEMQDPQAPLADPVRKAVHLRRPERAGLAERFAASDPSPGLDLTRNPRVARLVRNRKFQFLLILPNQIVFWTVIFVGLFGTARRRQPQRTWCAGHRHGPRGRFRRRRRGALRRHARSELRKGAHDDVDRAISRRAHRHGA